MKELVFGHRSPDTDAIDTAIAFSYLQNQLGYDTEAVALGEPSDETKYALNKFGYKAPRVVKTVANEVKAVMLVDHNEPQQSVADRDQVTVTHVVDHHRIMNFNTAAPLYYRAEPVGCTSTIVWEMFNEKGVEIPSKLAGLMLSAIISDTLLLKSPTTTDLDKKAVKALADLAGVDYQTYGLAMLKAGTNIADKAESDLIDQDAKSFELNGSNIRVAQINTVDLPEAMERKDAFLKAMQAEADQQGYDVFLVLLTDILNSNSKGLAIGSEAGKAGLEAAFNQKLQNGELDLPGVVSRKKQIVPPLTSAFEK
ncbi:MAG: manganese-dependent inorganic pyrophosphatase [Lactobacillus sp.]|jgi:manganese-dependent inorganic pyrophosphatase|nr:manganese-dependent inorganic pyrophosphatase [Lactobacillus sp.]